MMIGIDRVRRSARSLRADATPDSPGSIQSSRTTSGSALLINSCASSTVWARHGMWPACSRLTAISSSIGSSSSTIKTELGIATLDGQCLRARGVEPCDPHSALGLALQILEPGMAHVGALDDVNHVFGHVLGMIADALDRLGDPHDLQRAGDGARILHHESDELAHDGAEFVVDRDVLAHHLRRTRRTEAGERIQGLAQHLYRD